MARWLSAFLLVALWVQSAGAQTQDFTPPAPFPPDAATMKAINDKRAELKAAIDQLRKSDALTVWEGSTMPYKLHWDPMVEIFAKAADWIVRRNEFLQRESGKQTLAVLDEGLRRAKDWAGFIVSLKSVAGHTLACGYRSRVDDSIQPYVVTFPVDFGRDPKKKWRLDIVLHGRDSTLTEVKTLAGALKRGPTKPDQEFIQLEVFGRGNNAYRWSGETDVFEAKEACIDLVERTGKTKGEGGVDRNRIVLRGFSMGGAGAWHLGLHYPTNWCVIGPGAGFTETHGYISKLPAHLPSYQEACLHIYDAVDYAENAAMVPVVAYAGDKDPQQQAGKSIEERLKALGIPMTRLVGSGLAHQFPPEWQKKAEQAYAPFVERGLSQNSNKLHFVTYTLSYPTCDWITLLALEQHYARTTVDAAVKDDGYIIQTKNVRSLFLHAHPTLSKLVRLSCLIDGQSLTLERNQAGPHGTLVPRYGPGSFALTKVGNSWKETENDEFCKNRIAHGPIDDAFRDGFVCVRGTGKCASPQVQAYTDAALERFRREWELGFRGELPVVTDKEYMKERVRMSERRQPGEDSFINRSLILFGDPSSNQILAQIMTNAQPRQIIKWNAKEFVFGGQTYSAETHVPAFILPRRGLLNRYIVVNSGHTFHEADIKGTNALLYPRLGDFAILKPTPTAKDPAAAEVVRAGLFDENWRVPAVVAPTRK